MTTLHINNLKGSLKEIFIFNTNPTDFVSARKLPSAQRNACLLKRTSWIAQVKCLSNDELSGRKYPSEVRKYLGVSCGSSDYKLIYINSSVQA